MLLRGRLTIAAGTLVVLSAFSLLLGPSGGDAAVEEARDALPRVGAFGPEAVTTPESEPDPLEPKLPEAPRPRAPAPPPKARTGGKATGVPPEILARIPVPRPRAGKAGVPHLVASGKATPRLEGGERLSETVLMPVGHGVAAGPLRIDYTLDADLTDAIYDIFERGRVQLGLAVVLDPATGDVLAYAGTDARRLPPSEVYPAASLVKVLTAASALERSPRATEQGCRFAGNPYRLTPARVVPPAKGTTITLERALATSNNQCFAQLAVGQLGADRLLEIFGRFGLLARPGPGHEAGQAANPHGDRFALGKLGCGLAGLQITALHAAEIAATLADGKRREARWIARVRDADGNDLPLPARAEPKPVVTPALAATLREMMIATTTGGTARRAFRGSHGRPLLREMSVAGKTGSLSGKTPPGRYEWFIGVAPADKPKVAIAVLIVQQKRWHTTASQASAQILNAIFCARGVCHVERANQWLSARADRSAAPVQNRH